MSPHTILWACVVLNVMTTVWNIQFSMRARKLYRESLEYMSVLDLMAKNLAFANQGKENA